MSVKLIFVVLGGIVLSLVDNARILPRVKRQSLKVRITAKDDSIVLQYLSTSPVIKLQGYVLGLGGRFSRQNITLPVNGDPIEVDVEFNPKYLVAVHPVAEQNKAVFGKKCKGHLDLHKPPKLTIDPRTPTSVFLTWAPHSFKDKGYKVGKECEIERQFTVRYREKERDKEWKYQFCPTSETTINNLKPNTVYEFGIQVTKAKEGGNWSKPKTYTTTVTPQPRSTTNGQSKNESNKPEVNFNSGNTKHTRKHGLTERTNDGMRKVKGLGAPSSANNRTNWTLLLPKEPDLNTKAVIGGQSTSNSADVHPGKSSSPKPVITSKPEHTRDRLHDKEVIKKETTNTVSKPALKRSKTRKANDKPAMKPLTTKESKLSSSATPSFPSKPMLNSDRTEIQFPVFLTPSTASEHDTMDEFTEPEMPSSTKMPFNILRTTSDHTDVGNQELPEIELPSSSNSFLNPPDTPSALDSMGTKQFTEPEMPPTSSKLFDPTSEPDDMDTQTFTEPKIRYSSTSSLNPVPESVTMDTEILPELPSSTSSFSSSSDMVSKPDVVHTEWFTERVVEPTANSFFTTSNTIYEFDSPQREQISVPEFGKPFLSSSPVNSLESSKNDAVEPKQSTESSFTTSKAFITSNPITDADNKVQQPFADYALLDSDTPITVYEVNNPEEKESTVPAFDTSEVFTLKSDNELVASDSSHVFNPITQTTDTEPTDYVPMYDINNVSTLMTDHEIPVTDTPNVIYPIPEPESVTISDIEPADHAISTFHTPKTITVISGSKLPNPGMFNPITQSERPEVTGYMEPTADAPNMFRTSSGTKSQIIDTPVFTSIPESVPTKIRVTEVTDHTVSSSQTPNVVTLLPGHKQPVSDSPPHVLNPAIKSEPAKIRFSEVTEDHELSTSHTAKVFTLISGHERQATDIPSVINPIPEPDPAKIGEAEFTEDHELSTSHTTKVFTLISGYERQATDIPSVINPIPEPDHTNIGETDITEDHELSTSHTTKVFSFISGYERQATAIPSVINPIPEPDPTNAGEAEFTEDHELSTSHTTKVFSFISGYERQATAIPSVINPIPEPDPTNAGEAEFTEDHELSTSHTTKVFSFISGYERQATAIPSVINPIPEPDPTNAGEAEFTEDHELSTSHTTKVFSFISGYERQATAIPSVINPIPEPDPTNAGEAEFTEDHELSTSHTTTVFSLISGYEQQATDIPSVINPIPELDPAKRGEAEFTEDHELSTSHTTTVFSLISGYEQQATDIPSVINPIPELDPAKIGEAEFTEDHELSTLHTAKVFTLISGYERQATDIPSVINPIPEPDLTEIGEADITEDHELSTSHTTTVFSLISGYEQQATDIPSVINPIPELDPAKIGEAEFTENHELSTSHTTKVFTLISGYERQATDIPSVINPIPEPVPTNIVETDVTEDHELSTSHTTTVFSLISGYERQATDIPSVINPIPEPDPAKIGEAEFTEDHELSTAHTTKVFSFISGYERQATDIPSVINPIPQPDPTKIGEADVTDINVPVTDISNVPNALHASDTTKIEDTEITDQVVPTSDTSNVFTLMLNHELPVTDVIDPILESQQTRMRDTEVADHLVSTSRTPKVLTLITGLNPLVSDTPNVINPIPETERAKIKEFDVTDHEVPTSNMFSLIPDSDPPATDIPNILNPITKSEDIGDIKVADDEVPSSDIPFVVTLMPNYVLPLTDTPNTINPIPEPELANVKDTEVKDHEVKISEATTSVFTLMPDGGLPVTDIANVINPIPEPEHAQISDTEDHEPSTSKTAKLSNPTHVYNAGEKKQTEHKLPISDTSHVFIPTPVSEIDHIEDKKFTDRNLTNSGTSHVLDQSPISERGNTEDQELKAPIPTNSETSHSFSSTPKLGKKEDKEIADYTQLNSGTSPNIFNQEQRSALDNIENKDLADYKFSSSDTPNVFRPTPVSQVGNNGKKDHSVSDPPKDSSSIITSKPVHKTNAKVDRTGNGAETTSTVIRSSSSSSGTTQDKPPVFRSTPVSNIDGQGQERFRGTHVIYLKNVTMPCSITESLKHFPEENNTNAKFLNVPRYPPSNVTIVTVEGCPTFLIIGWMNNENDTAEYEVTSQMQGPDNKTEILVTVTNQTHTAVENLKPNTSYSFSVTPTNVHGRGPPSDPVPFVTESADPSVSEYIPGKDAIWTQYKFKFDSYSECQGKRFVKRTRYRKFVGIVLCNSLRYKIYLSNSLSGTFYNIGDLSGHGEDHCQFVDSFLDGRTGEHLLPEQLPIRQGFYRSVRQEPVMFGTIGGQTHIHYVHWYECGIAIPGQW
ncbi:target of Nesh-SH3 isoform X26 [Amblyraja radiata]|uniref:target of Nesh-SH3 isoform X26 n=1 Tax=Amblyraja radiata TaxID=386614 RepID=UPI0014034536|nr:target of Nesh-SH3 isoform X26 [Amblyraja radiata]